MAAPEHVVELLRHAESEMVVKAATAKVATFGGRQNHIPLSRTGPTNGIDEALQLGEHLLGERVKPTRVYSSPAVRALQTYEYSSITLGLELPVCVDNRLEELDWGDWTNGPRSVYQEDETQIAIRRDGIRFKPPNGESMYDVANRISSFLESLKAELDPTRPEYVLAYTHRGAIRSYVGVVHYGWTYEQIYATHPYTASRTQLVLRNGVWQLEFFNRPSK